MKAVLVIACISVFGIASTTGLRTVPQKLAEIFSITVEQAELCVNKTKVILEDLRAFEDQLGQSYNDKLLEQENTRRAICTLTCAAQAQGTMQGAKLQMPKIHELIDGVDGMSETTKNQMHQLVDICHTDVTDVTNECEVGLRFITCLITRGSKK